ncbi:alpha-ketoacid dehydrogenase subunit alpha/beta [Candidatus Merdisoma sp. HCP28S3_D10]|uniref:alpha-ketoacid dehydrogenase subunit alpha/beta n=1 Tax=unclassified Candidatus Merdisoma TaxID=3099611 RepID=UPI003F89F792
MPKSLYVDPDKMRAEGKITFKDIPINVYKKSVKEEVEEGNYTKEDLLRIYRDMSICREFEDMLNQIKTQAKYADVETTYPGPAHLSLGQEAAAVGEAYLLGKEDFTFGSHRSHSEILAKGLSCIQKLSDKELMDTMENFFDGKTLKAIQTVSKAEGDVKELAIEFLVYGALAELFARENGFHKGLGGSMHAFFLPFGIYPNNALVGGSATIATGASLFKKCNDKDGVVVANLGDGSMGRGPVWEALSFATMDQYRTLWEEGKKGGLPLIFNINNNSYGMGGQTCGETMGYGELARMGAGVTESQLHAERVDGYNPLAVIDAYRRKLPLVKSGEGPVFLDVVTYRLLGHSTSDQNAYRTKEEIEAWRAQDPLITFRKAIVDAGIAEDSEFDDIWAKTKERMARICRLAADKDASPYLDFDKDPAIVERLMLNNGHQRSMDTTREPSVMGPKENCKRYNDIQKKVRTHYIDGTEVSSMKRYNIRDAIFEPMFNKYYEDPTLIAYGEDVRDWGGAFAVYRGFTDVIPYSRLFNSPISESAIVGTGVGYTMCGGRAVIELMYGDFIGCCGDEIFNQMAKWQAMSAGILKMPLILRVSVGSKYGAQHSQDWTAMCAHVPGLKVCFPATPYEAKGLMQAALNGTDPVVFFESQRIYDVGEKFHEGGVPKEEYEITMGDVDIITEGSDVTILTVGATLYRAYDAVKELKEKYGISAELINLHSLVPLDYTKILESVKKTGKVVLASDACARGSFLDDVAKNITTLAFDYLDAPPAIVGAQNWITPPFEYDKYFFPQKEWILDAINEKIMPLKDYKPVTNMTAEEEIRKLKLGV